MLPEPTRTMILAVEILGVAKCDAMQAFTKTIQVLRYERWNGDAPLVLGVVRVLRLSRSITSSGTFSRSHADQSSSRRFPR